MSKAKPWFAPHWLGCICTRCGTDYYVYEWKPPFICSNCRSGQQRAAAYDQWLKVQREIGAA